MQAHFYCTSRAKRTCLFLKVDLRFIYQLQDLKGLLAYIVVSSAQLVSCRIEFLLDPPKRATAHATPSMLTCQRIISILTNGRPG